MSYIPHDYSPLLLADQGFDDAARQQFGRTGPKPQSQAREHSDEVYRIWRVAQQSLARHNEAQPA